MTSLDQDRAHWEALVDAVRRGDDSAWPGVIDRFEALAVATAVGMSGDLDGANDIAQEAFVLAFRHVGELDDPAAFPAWLQRLVRTATNRRTRRRRVATVPLDGAGSDGGAPLLIDPSPAPDEAVLKTSQAAQVRDAIERLPEAERCVVALHYLADLPYAEVAEFLDITTSAAKKRAWSARARLKELLPMVTDAFSDARRAGDTTLRDTILLFQAIRTRDAEALRRLLADNPSLATATEDWSPDEGFDSRLGFSERATALIRAAGTGELPLVELLVEAGAPVNDVCQCQDHESALMAAVNIGAVDIVDYLLDQGASVDGGAFDGESTALHVAVHRERHELVRRLLAAGADPTATDANGRTAADWAMLKSSQAPEPGDGDVLWTRIRAIDLFAPLRRGALVHLPPAYGLGAMRAIFGIVDALAPAEWWMVGFEHGPYEPGEFEVETRESGTPAVIDLVEPGRAADRRQQFASSLERLATAPGRKVVMCVPAPGFEHDVTVGLPGLAADPNVLATIVVAPYTADPGPVPPSLPEGFDARMTFDWVRAVARHFPAIDPARTSARIYPDERHERVAEAARVVLTDYAAADPEFVLPEPDTLADPVAAARAQALVRYLSHAFRPFEMMSGAPAADTPMAEVLDDVEQILATSS